MKMIDVLVKIANGEIKDQTVLEIHDPVNTLYTYTFNEKYKSFYSNTEYSRELGNYFKINDNFLNREVELIPPKPKKYYLRLNSDNDFSYVNWDGLSSCEFATKQRYYFGYKTKFTQEEIDGCEFLKFVEKYGVKEEAKDDEDEAEND